MKLKTEIKFSISNPFARFLVWLRMRRAIKKWNSDSVWIEEQCKTKEDHFKWSQLVWQEIWMWVLLGDPKGPRKEIDLLSERRGFNAEQRKYLEEMMRQVWMWA